MADSIESDMSNLSMLIQATGLAPPGLFLDNVIRVGREELTVECDYRREAANQRRFQSVIASDVRLVADQFVVPNVVEELSMERILVTELVHGGTIDKVADMDQSERDRIGVAIERARGRILVVRYVVPNTIAHYLYRPTSLDHFDTDSTAV